MRRTIKTMENRASAVCGCDARHDVDAGPCRRTGVAPIASGAGLRRNMRDSNARPKRWASDARMSLCTYCHAPSASITQAGFDLSPLFTIAPGLAARRRVLQSLGAITAKGRPNGRPFLLRPNHGRQQKRAVCAQSRGKPFVRPNWLHSSEIPTRSVPFQPSLIAISPKNAGMMSRYILRSRVG
jgi:hypothetical protein